MAVPLAVVFFDVDVSMDGFAAGPGVLRMSLSEGVHWYTNVKSTYPGLSIVEESERFPVSHHSVMSLLIYSVIVF